MRLPPAASIASIGHFLVLVAAASHPAAGQSTIRVSVDSAGLQSNGPSANASISSDGTVVVFQSTASNLVAGDTNGFRDVFARDLNNNTTERISRHPSGAQGNRDSDFPVISADGRYVAFRSTATNLASGDANGAAPDIYLHDRLTGSMVYASVGSTGVQGNNASHQPAISGDGRFVAFSSLATNLVAGDTNGTVDVFLRDQQLGTTIRVSVNSQGVQANGDCWNAALSADGRYVAFGSPATNLHPLGGSSSHAAFVHDTQTGTTICASLDVGGFPGGGGNPSLSPDGRYVGYFSSTANLVPGDTNNQADVFVYDLQMGALFRVIANSPGSPPNAELRPSLSLNARFIAFDTSAPDIVGLDSNGAYDVFVYDRLVGVAMRVSLSTAGSEADGDSFQPMITPDGNVLVFLSDATTLEPGDSNGTRDVYARDRRTNSFASLCDPGAGGVVSCPCGNAPAGVARGCSNSASTGGASLNASGVAYLSSDNVVFRATDERPTSLSILMQGNGVIPNGVAYGQGVRCVGGTIIRRLFVKSAGSGGVTAPDFGAGDPTVSARSLEKGDNIQPGQTRWYLMYYRDPNVLGGCPATSTFNASQTSQVTWSP